MTAPDLKPCPFCGGEARKWQDPSHSAAWFIGCDDGDRDCFGSIHWAETEAEAIAAWNRRAALPARWVGVKPLVWEPSVIGKPWHSAKAPWGWYYAQWDDETQAWFASLEMGEVEAPIILSPSDVPTIDAAKAAAQADYEARILSALEPDHAREARDAQMRAEGRVAGLREAAEMCHDEQVRVWAEEILSALALDGLLSVNTYDDKVAAYVAVSREIGEIGAAIRALADKIDGETNG